MKSNILQLAQALVSDTSETSFTKTNDGIDLKPEATSSYKDLTFPLNVYAQALLLQEGRVDYLHYGLFQEDQENLGAAQQYSTDLLLSRLPPAPCRILEVEVGLGTIFSLFTQKGYQVHGIIQDAQQIAQIQKRLGTQAHVTCQRLQDFKAPSGSFDVLLFQESSQGIEPLVIFNKGLDLLPDGGSLLIVDEFALSRVETGAEGLHLLSDLLALANRLGFELVEQLDLADMAAPMLAYLLRVTMLHRERLMNDLSLNAESLAQLDECNRKRQEKYACGRLGYALLHFRKKSNPTWRLRLLEENQAPDMLALFERTFGHSMSSAMWQWKYGRERGRAIGVWRQNQLVAHYGGMIRNILFFGEPRIAVQIGDVMVDSKERGVLTKRGPFFLMAATFQEYYVGYGKSILTGYGFPNERAMRVAERLRLYTNVGYMSELEWPALKGTPRWLTRLQAVDSSNIEEAWIIAAIDECWQKMAGDLRGALVGVRDWHYLRYRYLDHPHQHYQIVLIINRFDGKKRGLLVMRHDPESSEIMDLVAPLREIPLLIVHARRLAKINGRSKVFCRITENFAPCFIATGGIRKELGMAIPAPIWSDAPAAEMLHNRWWLMSGDTDFR